jgi:5-methyltetrahydrofolate--homocysteine methyltransferase
MCSISRTIPHDIFLNAFPCGWYILDILGARAPHNPSSYGFRMGTVTEKKSLFNQPVLVFDGACGTSIQRLHLPASVWGSFEGCNEYLNLSAPDHITAIHRAFLDAGAMVIETNTFGASSIVLREYGLQDKTLEINAAAVKNAQRAILPGTSALVAGSVGPTTKLPLLGHIGIEEMAASFQEQIRALICAGVDILIIETGQDLLQIKTAIIAAHEVMDELKIEVPLMASITVEKTGTMLVGAEVLAAAVALSPLGLFSLGINCATGPELMKTPLQTLAASVSCRISCMPNAGIPQVVGETTVYPLQPKEFAAHMASFVTDFGVSIVGGCCGTLPEHIQSLYKAVATLTPAQRTLSTRNLISSGFSAVEVVQEIPPLLIGERTNVNGSRQFRDLLLADEFEQALNVGIQQQESGAHALDLCTAYAGRDELADMTTMAGLFARTVKAPIVIDSTSPVCVEAALKHYPGRCIINSINLEDGGATLGVLCRLAKKYGAMVIALTINEKEMAMTAADKLATAKALYNLAVATYGLKPHDLLFDPLTFTIGSGDAATADAGKETLAALRLIKKNLPGVNTILGISNISFGLPKRARPYLNSMFLHEAVEAGLDAAIVDAAKIIPLHRMRERDRSVCLDLLYNNKSEQTPSPLEAFISYFADAAAGPATEKDEKDTPHAAVALRNKVIAGVREGTEDLLPILLGRMTAFAIVNDILVPAMRTVGELFGKGEMLLPFVLKSAEVMRSCVLFVEPSMDKSQQQSGVRVLLATVQGDVHDIGKNLVDIILSNNGYKVFNIGTKVPAEVIIQKAHELKAEVIGLSGLLVKSALVMRDNLDRFTEAGLTAPVLLGGAALTAKFVAESCVPRYAKPVVYCGDAFAGLKALGSFEAGTLSSTVFAARSETGTLQSVPKNTEIVFTGAAVKPPFTGMRHVFDIDPDLLFSFVNKESLYRGRWEYRRGALSTDDYRKLVGDTVEPLYERLRSEVLLGDLLKPAVAYGYFPCNGRENELHIRNSGKDHVLSFPRQKDPPHLCISDYFKPLETGPDVAGFFVATIGGRMNEEIKKLYESDHYHDYLMLHGLSVELTEALAEYWHGRMREEAGCRAQKRPEGARQEARNYQGVRYGFGFPACPDLEAHTVVFELLEAEKIGVTLTESREMVPEQSTSALVVFHPQAKYFAV